MKKSDAYSYVVYFLLLIMAVLLGLFVLKPNADQITSLAQGAKIGILIAAFSAGAIVLPILYELFHILGAKMGGYEVYSVCVYGFNFYKKDGKWKFRFKNYDGLTGETKVKPLNKNNKESNPKPFLIMGNLLYATAVLAFALLYLGFNPKTVDKSAYCVLMIISSLLLIYNFLPFELDAKTDGNQLRLVGKKDDVIAYNELLRLEACKFNGEDVGPIMIFDGITNFTAGINLISVYENIKLEKYNEALKILDTCLKGKEALSHSIFLRLQAQKLFILLFTNRIDEAKTFYTSYMDSDDRKLLSDDKSLECIRTYILVSTYIEPSESEIQYATSNADKAYKYVDEAYKEIEKKLYKETLAKAKEAYPNWELIAKDE